MELKCSIILEFLGNWQKYLFILTLNMLKMNILISRKTTLRVYKNT